MKQLFFGKYRGQVQNNVDPMQEGRVQVICPAVLGQGQSSWAMPCVPFAGNQVGFYTVPPVGANVWVEFEGGDPDYPIVAGCFWGAGEVPATPAVAEMKVLKTDTATITVSDVPGAGGITLEITSGAKIAITATGIEITNGQGAGITLQGPQTSVNDGALEVT